MSVRLPQCVYRARVSCRVPRAVAFLPRAIALSMSLLAATAAAQSPTATDAMTGTWTGRLGPGTNPTNAVTLQLRASGTEVSGTMTGLEQPGDTRKGTYDPATGALRLEMGITGQEGVQMVLEGTVVQGTAVGRVTVGSRTGTFILTRSGATPASTDSSAATVSRNDLRGAFDEVSGHIAKAAALVPPDKYGYRPVASVRTFGQLIGHIIDGSNYYCGRAAGERVEWSDAAARGSTDKASLAPKLEQAIARCRSIHASGHAGLLIANFGHANLHYGNVVTYLRLLGLVPPSSQ